MLVHDLKAKVCYEKTSFLLHMASFHCPSRVPHSVAIKIPTILYLGKVTTRVTIHIKNLVATKSWALPEPSLSHRPVCPGSFKKFGALSLRVAPWFPLRTWSVTCKLNRVVLTLLPRFHFIIAMMSDLDTSRCSGLRSSPLDSIYHQQSFYNRHWC